MNRPAMTNRTPLALIVTLILLLLAFFLRAVPLTLDAVRTNNAPGQFDTERALLRLGQVLDGTPHPVDSVALEQTRARLVRQISAMGFVPETRSHHSCIRQGQVTIRCGLVQNVFFRIGAASGPALLLTAHYDSVDVSPGFADDGIGLAVWLEVAHLLQQQSPAKPVVFLFTDGEEVGMLGAEAYVANREQYDFEVGRVINLEARGVSGPALMFETSHPNAGVVSDWARNGARLFANSMMTAIYELLPNGTDLTAHLEAGSHGINIAITGGSELYHSPRDDLASLDRTSVQHMGDQALGAARAFLQSDWTNDAQSGELVFADIASLIFLQLPQTFAQVLLTLCFVALALLLLHPQRQGGWRKPDWRALLLPPLFFIGAGLLVFALQQLLGTLRSEPAFWTAYPQALNVMIFAATLLVAALLLVWLVPRASALALFASGAFWLLVPGLALSYAIPGFTMLFLIPAVTLFLAAGVAWYWPHYSQPAYAVAGVVLALDLFPVIHLISGVMGLGTGAAYAVMAAMTVAPMLALLTAVPLQRRMVLTALSGMLGLAFTASLLLPAYSDERPYRLNFMAHYDIDEQDATLFAAAPAGALTAALREQFRVGEFAAPPGFAANLPARALDFVPVATANAQLLDEQLNEAGQRVVSLQLEAAGARGVRLNIPAAAQMVRLVYAGNVIDLHGSGAVVFEIVGESAHGAVLELTFAASAKTPATLQGMWSGLPAQAQPFVQQRPAQLIANRAGDNTVTTKKLNL